MNADVVFAAVLGATTAVSGWFLAHHRPARPSGALLVAGGGALLLGAAAAFLDLHGVGGVLLRSAGCALLPLAFVTYPVARWRDPVSFVLVTTTAAAGVLCVAWPPSFDALGYVLGSCLFVHVWWSYEQGDAAQRRSLGWSVLGWGGAGLVTLFVLFLGEATTSPDWNDVGFGILVAVVGPPAMVVGSLRPEVVDVRGLVTRTVVAISVLAAYVAVADALVAVLEDQRGKPLEPIPTIVLCAVLAFGVRPLQIALRGVVDQLLFGDRPDPLAAATVLADRIGDDPVLALDAIREALVLPYASLRVAELELAASGTEVTHTRVLPLRLGDDEIGEFVIGMRAGDLTLSPADADVLRIVAPLLAQTLRAQAMTRDLQLSREAVVAAVEEERRRLRRDLHDGLGPTLTGVAFAVDAARNQVHSDPARAEQLLASLRTDTAAAITEIRRLVEGLRPPALDQVGLLGSVRQYAATLHSADGSRLEVDVEAPTPLPALSAATEVAAYRILVEALTNTARHAGARRARVSVEVGEHDLVLRVLDDGAGTTTWKPGVGITSMRERAQQVGGRLHVSSRAGGLVEASLPLGRSADPPG
ncbi:MAG: sensor histidine kinase [Marmoricola sp.]